MSGDGTDALEQALALRLVPGRLAALRSRPLPEHMLVLLELVAGKREAIQHCAGRTAESPRTLVEAATLFIQQVLFDESSDHYRLLGAQPGDPIETIHEHHRWLMRWLHPDRDARRWETAFSERVNVAWHILRSPERRQEYDIWLEATASPRKLRVVGPLPARRPPEPEDLVRRLSPRLIRQLPFYAIAVLAIVCTGLIASEYRTQSQWRTPVMTGVTSGRDVEAEAARKALADDRDPENFGALGATTPTVAARSTMTRAGAAEVSTTLAGADSTAVDPSDTQSVMGSGMTDVSSTHPSHDESLSSALPATSFVDVATVTEPTMATLAQKQSSAATASTVATPSARGADPAAKLVRMSAGRSPATVSATTLPQSMNTSTAPAMPLRTLALANPSLEMGLLPPSAQANLLKPIQTSARARAAKAVVSRPVHPRDTSEPRRTDASSAPMASLAGASSSALPAAATASMMSMPPSDATRSVSHALTEAYARGDIDRMMRLFAPDAVENRGGVDAIEEDYRTLFNQTSSRELDLGALTWVIHPDRIVGDGAFVASVHKPGGGGVRRIDGWIHIEAVPMGGEWKIHSLLHRNDR